jgi:glycosyltransferase involved in cell wall biosynthesis
VAAGRRRFQVARLSRRPRAGALSVTLDATPLLGQATGVGRYTRELLAALARLPDEERPELCATAFTWRGHESLGSLLPAGVRPAGLRVPARFLQQAWARVDVPTMPMLRAAADVVHGTNFVLPPPGRGRAGVVTVHDLAYLRFPDTVSPASARYRILVPRGLQRAGLVITPTEAVAEEVRAEYGLPAERVRAIAHGVEPAWFEAGTGPDPRQRHPDLPERYLLFVGALEPRKDIATLLRALRMLRRDDPTTPPLVLVGPAGWGPALDTAGLSTGDVRLLGYLDAARLRPVLAHATALCYPSLYEGFGLPPLESLAAGVPVVASDIAAVREVVGPLTGAGPKGGAAVRLVPVGDAEALAQAMAETVRDRDAGRHDPEPGRAHAISFTWERAARHTAQTYRDTAGK